MEKESPNKADHSYDKQQKAFFITINNPEKYGYSQEKICDIIHEKFRHMVYFCMSAEQGSCYHYHIYILLSAKKRWSAVQKAFPHAHLETNTKGTPSDCRAYIRKEGAKYRNKAETNFPDTFYEEGDIPQCYISNNRAEMLQQAEQLIADGYKPDQIFSLSLAFRQYESIIRKAYIEKRFRETPPKRNVKVVWHLGASGSGKSYSYVQLCDAHGIDSVFFAADYTNNCSALFDNYQAEEIVFIDEVKPDSIKLGFMLILLQGYRAPIHSRYSNTYSVWNEVHITSVYTPKELYDEMGIHNENVDTFGQLERRISYYAYHWRDKEGQYRTHEIAASEFVSYEDLKTKAERITAVDDFVAVTDETETPFA